METVLVPTHSRTDPSADLIDLSDPEDPFQRMKACSVVTFGERTLLRLPWSGLQKQNERGPSSLAVEDPGSGRWAVAARSGPFPGTYERSVFRALEWIAIDASVAQGLSFSNPLIVHPRDLCERLCWRATQPQFEAIEQAMQALCRVEIEHAPPGKPAARFGLLRSAIPGTQRSVNRTQTCPHFVVYFDRFFVESVNAGQVRPINWGLWIALREPLAQRLLEIVDPEFAPKDGALRATLDADDLARRLPLAAPSPRRRRALLDQAHEALIRRGYLRQVDRLVTSSSETLTYHPGPTYRAMRFRLERQPALHPYRRLLRDVLGPARA